ncbi:nitroreductase [Sphingomonas sp. MG17]|uniref:Nitroreductase n=1 Tax=Sphingomonas tagetis TaxID=2949092 RepID=A0A9X2HPP5_9SPHN|nr:nitroreductase [Sphingomonas tagetis]MCP3731238.1 nitroreductase [Sphingomonas tagetis]
MTDKPARSISALDAVTSRRSVRRFLPDTVSDRTVYDLLDAAARAPSGQNMQPWLVHVVTGETRATLCREVSAAVERGERTDEYPYFPQQIREPYLSRRRKIGFDLFEIYGIGREDMAGRRQALLRNFEFFGAPVGLFFTMERDWGMGAWIDCAMLMTNVMTLAPAFGLRTCPQQAWCEYGPVVHRVLDIPDSHVIISGMALGYADAQARENRLTTDRVPAAQFVTRHI